MKKVISLLVMILLVTSACEKDSKDTVDTENPASFGSNEFEQNVLYRGTTKYTMVFDTRNPLLGYSSFKENPLSQVLLTGVEMDGICPCDDQPTRKSSDEFKFDLTVNGIRLIDFKDRYNHNDNKSNFSQLYGREVTFTINRLNPAEMGVSSSRSKSVENSMYVPELIEIASPRIELEKDLLPYCYYKGFVLRWNADYQNENGVVVIVEWTGATISGKHTAKHVRNIDVIPDDSGETVLNEKLFDNIPQFGVVFLTLLRGNVDIATFDSENDEEVQSIRLAAVTQASLPMILIRELK